MRIPAQLAAAWRHEPAWLEALPRISAECAEAWDLQLELPIDTPHSLVVPAGDVVLKLNAPAHFEADHEAEALARWRGAGAVRLVARDDVRRALLIERCRPGTRLWDAGSDEPTAIAELLPRLRHEPEGTHPFRLLVDEARRWALEVPKRYELAGGPFPRTLLDRSLEVFLSADPRASHLVNQDLHGGNVLSAEREPWLVVDPKPLVGERELDGVGLLRNAVAGQASSASVARWLDTLRDLGLDRERLRGWGTAHALAWGWDEQAGWSRDAIEIATAIRDA